MSSLPVTSLFAAGALVALVVLSLSVSFRRKATNISTGAGADDLLLRRMRTHGNFVENVPFGLIGLGLVEASGVAIWGVAALGGIFALGRAAHAHGMLTGRLPSRAFGMITTHAAFLAIAIVLSISHV